ncbi:MAG: hypothetical protein ACOYXO_08350, partial [Chloroflexota bacterium]
MIIAASGTNLPIKNGMEGCASIPFYEEPAGVPQGRATKSKVSFTSSSVFSTPKIEIGPTPK